MGVDRKYHRQGIGGAFVEAAEYWALERSFEHLTVKTVGPSREDPDYHKTRQFYLAVGFAALVETNLWGEACLIMVKHLRCQNDQA